MRLPRRSNLPDMIQFEENKLPDNEFAFFLRGRVNEWRELNLRPIVYHLLHCNLSHTAIPEMPGLAHQAVEIWVSQILQAATQRRHGGSWLATRQCFQSACLLLAVALKPDCGFQFPPQWQSIIRLAIRTLQVWGREAPDVKRMATTLESLLRRTCEEMQTGELV